MSSVSQTAPRRSRAGASDATAEALGRERLDARLERLGIGRGRGEAPPQAGRSSTRARSVREERSEARVARRVHDALSSHCRSSASYGLRADLRRLEHARGQEVALRLQDVGARDDCEDAEPRAQPHLPPPAKHIGTHFAKLTFAVLGAEGNRFVRHYAKHPGNHECDSYVFKNG